MADLNLDRTHAQIDRTCFVAPGVVVIGAITMGAQASVWYNCVLRGDVATITIGERTNIQDGTIIHADEGFPTAIGSDCTVGHGAVVHGATIEDGCLIGMRAVLLNGCCVGAGSIVGSGAVVTEGTRIPARSLVLGVPAKVVRALDEKQAERGRRGAADYVRFAQAHKRSWEQGR
jgi:carbonic anhydrase/acetyltransferase-like protein (isoleucine patch superfamily)